MKALFAASLLLTALTVHAQPKIGDNAPDFDLPGSDGQQHRLSEMRGRFVAIAFFPKAYTRG